jgi:very-short-patch-repair endonuclease
MKIYLAGKISNSDWRQSLLPKHILERRDKTVSHWEWPTQHSVFKTEKTTHDYVGPYFMSAAMSDGFPTHGAVDDCTDRSHAMQLCGGQSKVAELCFEAVTKADFVFAWIDGSGAYGTCAEIGYAAALGKQIYIHTSEAVEDSWEYWLPKTHSTIKIDRVATGGGIRAVFAEALAKAEKVYYPQRRDYLLSRIVDNSQIERKLINKMYECNPQLLDLVINQYPMGRYRLDFVVPKIKLCIELDGHDSHKSKDARTHDAFRDRTLTKQGWTTIRFTGSEVFRNPRKTCDEIAEHINRKRLFANIA